MPAVPRTRVPDDLVAMTVVSRVKTRRPIVAALCLTAVTCGEPAFENRYEGRRLAVGGATMGTTFTVTVALAAHEAARRDPRAAAPREGQPADHVSANGAVAEGQLADGARPGAVPALAREDVGPPAGAPFLDPAALQAAVQRRLDRVEERMSHYRPDSELSRFNGAQSTAPQPMSGETLGVLAEALAVSRASGGAFDVTVGPLVDAWGFGPAGRAPAAPDEAALAALRTRVGSELLEIDAAASTLRKRRAEVVVDLSAIAKGYAVDAVASLLADLGVRNYLVEIGGELRAAGANEEGAPWRVAIERPAPGAPAAQRIVPLTDAALATSGDYRNFYDLDGARVSHMLDPRTGRPVTHGLRSVSVIAERCSLADARSTALAVLGPDAGYTLAAEQGWAALFVTDDGTGRLVERETPAFAAAVR